MTEQNKLNEYSTQTDRIVITYYTDPLCCWSWAFEPQWRRLLFEFRGMIDYQYKMAGMLADWKRYNDPMNSVRRPVQMGPVWVEAKYTSGMPIDETIWIDNPPSSSYPACIAVKAAELQSREAGERMLRLLRQAVMMDKKNIAEPSVILDLAEELAKDGFVEFNPDRFRTDFLGEPGRSAFSEDYRLARQHQIGRFPTLTITKGNQGGVILTGYRPYPVLLQALSAVDESLLDQRRKVDLDEYSNFWHKDLTKRELQEVGSPVDAAPS